MGAATALLGLPALLAGLGAARARNWPRASLIAFFALALVGYALLTLSASAPVWRLVKPLELVQFPCRMLGPAAVCSAALVGALRKADPIGEIETGGKKWTIRYARAHPSEKVRRIVAVVDQPMFFVGGGQVDAKPREGYDVAVVQFEIDGAGLGHGTMTAAARVTTGGPDGIDIADYAERPIKLLTVTKSYR